MKIGEGRQSAKSRQINKASTRRMKDPIRITPVKYKNDRPITVGEDAF